VELQCYCNTIAKRLHSVGVKRTAKLVSWKCDLWVVFCFNA